MSNNNKEVLLSVKNVDIVFAKEEKARFRAVKNANFDIYKGETLPEEVKKYQPPVDYGTLLGDLNLQGLNKIFRETLKRKVDKIDPIRSQFGNIQKDEIEMDIKTEYIKEYILSHSELSFRDLLEKQNSKMEIIVTFLVVLELIKVGVVTIVQDNIFDDILICVSEDAGSATSTAQSLFKSSVHSSYEASSLMSVTSLWNLFAVWAMIAAGRA
mgnify:CR=1 FL=1